MARLTRCPYSVTKDKHNKNNRSTELNIGSWNVRTLLEDTSTSANRPGRRTALVSRELARLRIDIAALSETRFAEEGQLEEVGGGYTFFWKGVDEGEHRVAGVGFAIKSELVRHLEELPTGVNERIMTMRLPLKCGRFATVISIYAPTLQSSDEVKGTFYNKLRDILSKVSPGDKIWLCGDFNARVGTDCDTWNVLGKHGVGSMNENGLLLLQLCTEFGLVLGNTLFQQQDKYKVTWMHPRSKHWHLIDYIIVRKRDRQDLRLVRVCRSAECWTDHNLVRAKLRLRIKPKQRMNNIKVPRKLNARRLRNPDIQMKFANNLQCLDGVKDWAMLKDTLYRVGEEVLGFTTKSHKDWFDDNDVEIDQLLSEKRTAEAKCLAGGLTFEERHRRKVHVRSVKAKVQKRLRQIECSWWDVKVHQIQEASNTGNTERLHSLLREVHGPRPASVSPLKSADGSSTIKDPKGILDRWREHFEELLNRPSVVNENFMDTVEQNDIKWAMNVTPTLEEVNVAIDKLKLGKSPGRDGIVAEMLRFGGVHVRKVVWEIICNFWGCESVHQDWRDAVMIVLYKFKGKRDVCGNYRGISLLCVVGKVMSRLLLTRLNTHICSDVLPESQCGFRASRGTSDMIFSARQLQEKCREQRVDLYQVFIDLTKAFDTVNRNALWKILKRIGCPDKFVNILQSFHDNMQVWVSSSGELSDPINVNNGVKQGDIPAPALFSIYFYIVFLLAFQVEDAPGVYIRYRTSGKLFKLNRFAAKTLISMSVIRDLLYADDCDLVTHSEADMQKMMDLFATACTALGLTISLEKTKVMYTPAPGKEYVEPKILVYGQLLDVVDEFVYLGSKLHQSCSLDSEVIHRISRATAAFGKLRNRCWSRRGITSQTKVEIYKTCVRSALTYALETGTLYAKHIRKLEHFQQRCLREILGIRWESNTTNESVLDRACCESIESFAMRSRLRWSGHVARMPDSRIPKQLLYGELCLGNRAQGGQMLRYKDVLRQTLKKCNIGENWEQEAKDRTTWRKTLHEGVDDSEKRRTDFAGLKRAVRKGQDHHLIDTLNTIKCDICGRVILNKPGYMSHMEMHKRRGHTNRPDPQPAIVLHNIMFCNCLDCRTVSGRAADEEPTILQCNICDKVCKNKGGLTNHSKIHQRRGQKTCSRIADTTHLPSLKCNVCGKVCKSKGGLTLHLKVH